jgi:exonuclease SbcD
MKRIVIVDAHPGKPATLASHALTSGRTLRSISGTIEELQAQAESFADDLLRVTIQLDKATPGIADRIREFLPNALHVNVNVPRPPDVDEPIDSVTDPNELFSAFFKQRYQTAPPEAVARLFHDLYEEEVSASD